MHIQNLVSVPMASSLNQLKYTALRETKKAFNSTVV